MAVETALVSLLLITMLYGIVETSFAYRDALVVSSASRAGARTAAGLPRDPAFATSAAAQVTSALGSMNLSRVNTVWVFKANPATGLPDSGNFSTCTTCVKFVPSGSTLVVSGTPGWTWDSQNACAGTVDTLGVYVQYRYPSRLGMFFKNTVMTESTVMRLEPYDRVGACKP
ncbi:TadE/TadG family type IV pilus assembly protein [Pedococcus soli]